MPIFPQSRYQQASVLRLPKSNGVYNLSVLRTAPLLNTPFSLYVWKNGDRLDNVSYQKLGDAKLWWSIVDLNPEFIYPLDLIPGTVIRIPQGPVMGQGTLRQ